VEKFSVLMSVYIKEKAEYLRVCLDSILENTVVPNEIVIVKDGPLTEELETTLSEYIDLNENLYNIVPLATNRGLGLALAEGILHCANELVARMDTDDIAVPDRFETQLKAFEADPSLDICGGQIVEFDTDPEKPIAERRVPLTHDAIAAYQKKRSAFNHMTVMYKKSKVLGAGNYKDCPLMEDDMLWVDMLLSGAKCANINKVLCNVRTDYDMIGRRGGLQYYKKYKRGRRMILNTGYITKREFRKTNRIQFIVCIMPKWLRKKVFFGLLHKQINGKS
jgi:glycosyltransferase involved in cell wall biosynthesis